MSDQIIQAVQNLTKNMIAPPVKLHKNMRIAYNGIHKWPSWYESNKKRGVI